MSPVRAAFNELGPETRVKLGVVLGIAALIVPAIWWSAVAVSGQQHKLQEIQRSIDEAAFDRYSGRDHDAFAARLAELNTNLAVPYWRDLRAGRVVRDVRQVREEPR